MLSEEVIRYAGHHNWIIETAEIPDAADGAAHPDDTGANAAGATQAQMLQETLEHNRYPTVYDAFAGDSVSADDRAYFQSLEDGVKCTNRTTMQVAIADMFHKYFRVFGEWVPPADLGFSGEGEGESSTSAAPR
jgi:hypothetical protein